MFPKVDLQRVLAKHAKPVLTATVSKKQSQEACLWRMSAWDMMQVDGVLRRASALQEAWPISECARIHPETAKHLGVKEGPVQLVQAGRTLQVKVVYDAMVAPDCIVLAATGIGGRLGAVLGPVTLEIGA